MSAPVLGTVGFVSSVTGMTTFTTSITVDADADCLYIGICGTPAGTSSGVTVNGTPMTLVGTGTGGSAGTGRYVSVYRMVAPPTGSVTVVSTLAVAQVRGVMWQCWKNVDPATPNTTPVTAGSGANTTLSGATSGFPTVAWFGFRGIGTATVGAGQTIINPQTSNGVNGTNQMYLTTQQPSGATASFSFSPGDSCALVEYGVNGAAATVIGAGWPVKLMVGGVAEVAHLYVMDGGNANTPSDLQIIGAGVTPQPPPETEEHLELPWNLKPSLAGLGGPVMYHYFTQFPWRQDNNPNGPTEYYQNHWLKPGGTEGGVDFKPMGGWLRDRTPNRPVLGSNWKTVDMTHEIQWAMASKADGFFIDLLSITAGNHKTNYDLLFSCNATLGRPLKLALMPDGTSSTTNTNADPTTAARTLADYMTPYVQDAAWFTYQGKKCIGVYGPEKTTQGWSYTQRGTYWAAFRARLATNLGIAGSALFLWGCTVDAWQSAAANATLNAAFDGWGRWGDRDANTCAANTVNNRGAPASCHSTYGKPWMHWFAPGDTRPRDGTTSYRTWEQLGTMTLHNTWMAAIDGGADMIQGTTWNDYSEHAHMAPSLNHGFSLMDLNTWYITHYKTGTPPIIQRDGLFLFHRVHPHALASFPGTLQTKFGANAASATPRQNIVDVRCFLTAPGDLEFLTGGSVTTTVAGVAAGMTDHQFTLPTTGTNLMFSARIKRAGVTVPGTVVTSNQGYGSTGQIADDFHYRGFSSRRQFTGTDTP